ncbi:hypothetical protein DPX16_14443 [Anabarilius grahami]|uniref:Uncharacterized protein n=1 Tax=Anabarilius grahami TaxID=495550 RepID=A0A3N0YY09_ANAGA|nr:hypothetical protein DPX16_14443 [Anabarilius grahami]
MKQTDGRNQDDEVDETEDKDQDQEPQVSAQVSTGESVCRVTRPDNGVKGVVGCTDDGEQVQMISIPGIVSEWADLVLMAGSMVLLTP